MNVSLGAALATLGGAVIVLDSDLRIVAASTDASALIGAAIPVGERAVNVLCGDGETRPIADALAAGRPAIGTIVRPRLDRDVALRVHAQPLVDHAGWLLRLTEDAPSIATHAAVDDHGIVTADPGMKRLLHVVSKAAATDVTVIVRGETGTGKELLARAVHTLSRRAAGPFRAINCAALSPSLLESELFGHVRGAFTGAVRDNPGHFRHADGGTLLLDEVAEMPPDLQAKLLRVIETGAVIPVGAMDPVHVDVRIVAATHKSLRAEVAAGRFRADLMYRLRKVPVFLPPLRRRHGDIELLARRFVGSLNERGGRRVEHITADAIAVLTGYEWPGNVRELANALEYAFVVGEGPSLVVADLPPEIADPSESPDALLSAPVNVGPRSDVAPSEGTRISHALERAGGHRERAAQLLGISRVTLWRRMKDLGLAATRPSPT